MMKQRSIPAVTLASLLGLAACSAEEPPSPPPAVRPVKTLLIDAPDVGGTRTFPGRIAAARRAELAFRVPGKLQEIPVVEGQEVKQGDLVAGLDPTDYQITFNDRKATFERSRADYERGQKLVEQGTISRRDFDALTANFKSSEAALQQAQQDLIYTKLIAPFDGIIVRRLIDNFEEIPAREPVLVINDISSLEVKIDIPEGLMQRLRRREQGDPGQPEARVFAIFDAAPGQQYPLEFKEVAARADPQTQTFEVTLTMPPPEGLNVLSGMTTSAETALRSAILRDPLGCGHW
jgi:RND family efflux transporter MFP subunit